MSETKSVNGTVNDIESSLERSTPLVGIGGCLAGQSVRYNGSTKKPNTVIKNLQSSFDLQPFCPEVSIGLGVPREPIRLVMEAGEVFAKDSETQQKDYTGKLQSAAADLLTRQPQLAGYILVKGSPSCGMERVKLYNERRNPVPSNGTGDDVGIFARELMRLDPLLPVEEDGRLNDLGLCEHFVLRVWVYHEWKTLLATFRAQESVQHRQLIDFHARHKYLLMAHHVPSYKEAGRLLAEPNRQNPLQQAEDYITILMQGLNHPMSRKGYSNALSHIKGYLKRRINSAERMSLDTVIEQYRRGELPLVVPVRMLQHYFELHPNDYISHQAFLRDHAGTIGRCNWS